ncbi:MAG: hypothetical protein JO287_07015 [Pseudonocardiales bacterium]|nr:hypothetical protein [Pseudonocardiales bacterium]
MSRNGRGITVAVLAGAIGSGGTSVLAALCCVGPGMYAVLGAGGSLAAARVAPLRPYLLIFAAACLAIGFWSAYRPPGSADACPARGLRWVRAALWSAAVFTVIAAVLGQSFGRP